jgi:hypothetical protein
MGEICQIGVPPDPAFKTTFGAVDILLLIILLLGMALFTLWGSEDHTIGRRWFGLHGSVIVATLLSLSAAFAVAMAWFLLIPSSDALKQWLNVQERLNPASCSDMIDAIYYAASDELGWYHTFLFFIPAFVGGLGLFILQWRAKPRPTS